MKRNVGGYDQALRIGVAIAFFIGVVILPRALQGRPRIRRWLRYGLLYAGADLLLTSLVQWCPVNRLLGINTCDRPLHREVTRLYRRLATSEADLSEVEPLALR